MSSSIGRAVLEISVDDREARTALENFKRASEDTATGVRSIGAAINLAVFREFAEIAARAVTAVARAIVDLGERGSDILDVAESFGTLSQQAGSTAATMLGELRAGTAGVISDFELMQMSNASLSSGLVRSADDMGTLAAGARALGNVTGQDTKAAFETLLNSIASGRTTQLRQLGLFVDNRAAVEAFARANGVAVGDLTDAQRAQALSAATLDALRAKLAEMPSAARDFGEMIAAARTAVTNFTDGLSASIAASPVFQTALAGMGQALDAALGGQQGAIIGAVVRGIEVLVVGLVVRITEMGQVAVEVARGISNAWNGLKFAFNEICGAIATALSSVVSGIAGVLQTASRIPGIGQQFAGAAQFARAFANDLQFVATGFAAQGQAALDNAGRTNAALTQISTTLGRVRQEVVTAFQEQTTAAQGAATAAAGIGTSLQTAALAGEAATTQLSTALGSIATANQGAATQIGQVQAQARNQVQQTAQVVVAAAGQIAGAHQAANQSIRNEFSQTAQDAIEKNAIIQQSGEAAASAVQAATETAEGGRREATGETERYQLTSAQAVVQGTLGIFEVLGRRYKAAAIAGAIISTYQAIAKALASAPWPASALLAARAGLEGWAQVRAIQNSQPGWAMGTPGLDFRNFGPASLSVLHGQEAVVPRGGGHLLAAEIAAALPDRESDASVATLREIRDGINALPRTLKRAIRDGLILAT